MLKSKYVFYAFLIVLVLSSACSGPGEPSRTPGQESMKTLPAQEPPATTLPAKEPKQAPSPEEPKQIKPKEPAWKSGGVAIAGTYADAEIVELGNGSYRMYYAIEPEVPGNKLEVFSAISADGINWKQEPGVRREFSVFPDVVRLPNGGFRMYFQNMGVIKSAVSKNGLEWTDEPGVRIDTQNNLGLNLENVAAPSTMPINDAYVMVYSGTINQRYAQNVPNSDTHIFLWATSKDGLTFEKKGIALDSRNSIFVGWLDGPELVKWDDGEIRLYFWSYRGIYHIVFKNGTFSQEAKLDFTTASDPRRPFPENPPSDPTLAKINSTWFMYYGQHTKGIYYATLE